MLLAWLYFLGLTSLVASSANNVFTNSFLVRFRRSVDNDIVNKIATRNGFHNIGGAVSTENIQLKYVKKKKNVQMLK